MSAGIYQHRIRKAGEIVTAPLYNTAHHNHFNNDVPTSAGRVGEGVTSADALTDFRATTDPYPASIATPVVDLGSELQQLRFVINQIKTVLNQGVPPTWWYTPITVSAVIFKAHGARVTRSASQTLPQSTATPMSFTAVDYDTGVVDPTFDPFFKAGTPTRLTAPVRGLYEIIGFVTIVDNAHTTGTWSAYIRLNGVTTLAIRRQGQDTAVTHTDMNVSTQMVLNAGDYVELVADQNIAAAGDTFAGAFEIELLNPLANVPPATRHTLTVTVVGSGTVTSSPGTINTSTTQSEMFVEGTVVNLTATPNGGRFVAWSGDVPVGHETDNPVAITMSADKSVTATFIAHGALVATRATAPLGAGTYYLSLTTEMAAQSSPSLGNTTVRLPAAITLRSLYVRLGAVVGGGTLTMKFYVNGVASGAIVISLTTPPGNLVAHADGVIALSAGDTLAVQAVTTLGSVVINSISARYEL